MKKLEQWIYLTDDVVEFGKYLLGKVIVTQFEEGITKAVIVETESYKGPEDRASHAYQLKKTSRNQTMYEKGGVAYVFLCYGVHSLFNVVCNQKEIPHAVLIRAIEPLEGVEMMMKRRKLHQFSLKISNGPGLLTEALGIKKEHNGQSLLGEKIWIEERKDIQPQEILSSPRVGIAYAKEDACLPWRFRIKNNNWTSPAKA